MLFKEELFLYPKKGEKMENKNKKTLPTVLTIAGSDCSGGAGIQADLKSIIMNGSYGMSVITALTAQNTMGVTAIEEPPIEFLEKQLEAVFEDIYPDAIKIGMVFSKEIVKEIVETLKKYDAKNIVIDPVMIATSGSKLLSDDAIDSVKKDLLPLATVITPNILEAEELCGIKINNEEDMEKAGKKLVEMYGVAALVKGGHSVNDANDVLVTKEKITWFKGKRIENDNTHGTGCTLSSAIATYLSQGNSLEKSIELAKDYLSEALSDMLDLGKGRGPMNHGYKITRKM